MATKRRLKLKKNAKRKLVLIAGLSSCILLLSLCAMFFVDQRTYVDEGVELSDVMGIPVHHEYVPETYQKRPMILREIRYIVIHETDNVEESADAHNHSLYITSNSTDINSWHYTVDDHSIYHHIPDEEVAWHAGDQLTEHGGNHSGVGIEMCVNEGGDFAKTMDNTAKLTATLLHEYNLGVNDVKRHYDFSGKLCPAHLIEESEWEAFLVLVSKYYEMI